MIGASPQFGLREMRRQALDSLKKLNGSDFMGIKIHIDIDSFIENIPPEPCDCFECWKIREGFI